MAGRRWLLAASLLALAASEPRPAQAAPPEPVQAAKGLLLDRIVAVVDGQTVTQAELVAEARLALVRRAPSGSALEDAVRAVPDGAFLHDFLTYLLGQMLVAREARRVGAEDVSDAEVEAAFSRFATGFASAQQLDAFLTELGVEPRFVRDVLRREHTNEHYLNQRLRTRLAGLGVRGGPTGRAAEDARALALRAAALRTFLPAYLQELRQSVEIRRLSAKGALEREPRR